MQVSKSIYPFDGHYLDRSGLRLHYLDEGQGDPILMVHGNPTWSLFYRNLVLGLRNDYRTIVPDHIGMGLSDKPDDSQYGYALADRIADLEALINSLKLEKKLTLVMHDWGGMIGMGYAGRHPERIGRLILLNTAAFHLPSDMKLPASIDFVRNSKLGALMVRQFNFFSRGASRVCTSRPMSRELRRAYCAPYDSWRNRIGTLRFVQDIPLQPNDPSYAVVSEVENNLTQFKDTPVLFCWGDKDFVFTPRVLEKWQQIWPHAQVHRIANGGHYVLEDAAEPVRDTIATFLRAHPLSPP